MEDQFRAIIEAIGENPDREGLVKTPHRAARAMEFLTQGYEQDLEEIVNGAIFPSANDEMVIVRDIELYSMCEHHLLPFIGKCHVAYLPAGKVIGLSKIPRIVDMYSRRLQIQENLTQQIGESIRQVTEANGVASCTATLGGLLGNVLNGGYTATFEGTAQFEGSSAQGALLKL